MFILLDNSGHTPLGTDQQSIVLIWKTTIYLTAAIPPFIFVSANIIECIASIAGFLVITLHEIAEKAGVTQMTVSRVLNGTYAAKRPSALNRAERIRRIARELGYRPNTAAQATASGKFNSIALVCAHGRTTSTLPQSLLYGLSDALAHRKKQLVMSRLSDQALTDDQQLPLFLRQHACDGLLLNYTHCIPDGIRELIDQYRIPSIWLNVKQSHDCVHPDDFSASRHATHWLISKGHRRIVYADLKCQTQGALPDHYSVADRLAGYKAAMQEAGLPVQTMQQRDLKRDQEQVIRIRTLLASADRPTAMLGYGMESSAAYMAAMQLGLQVPNDLELVGFANNVISLGGIPIPTIRLSAKMLGCAAAAAVIAKVDQPDRKLPALAVPLDPEPVTEEDVPSPAMDYEKCLEADPG